MRILQLSDPHLLADPEGLCRGRRSLARLREGLELLLTRLAAAATPPDLLLLSGDLCQDESWGGYGRLRELLAAQPGLPPVALLPGNHDHPLLLRAALARKATLAPARLSLGQGPGSWRLLLLDSHLPGRVEGRLGEAQRAWLQRELAAAAADGAWLLLAVHHPPLPIGDPMLDAIGLDDGPALLELLASAPAVRALVFGHVHQYWRGSLPGAAGRPLLACPSSLAPFGPVQPCPLRRPEDPGALLLELQQTGEIRHQLLRWTAADAPSVLVAPAHPGP
ncbi:MAG: metallophosphoesterase [Cyanobium sp.]